MLVAHLTKAANLLDAMGSEAALQASEGIDSVLGSLMTSVANTDPMVHLEQALRHLEGATVGVARSDSGMAKALTVITRQVGQIANFLREDRANAELDDKTQEGAPFGTTQVKTQEDVPKAGEFFSEDRTEPGSDPGMWMPSAPTKASVVLERLVRVADFLDSEGQTEAAALIEVIVKDAMDLPNSPGLLKTREDLYDSAAHNKEVMWPITKQEVEENRKNHHLLTMRDHAMSLSTRYPPDLPGVQMMHVADGVYQDIVTKKIYDYNAGFSGPDGQKYPGGSVKNQTQNLNQIANPARLFDTKVNVDK